MKSGRNWYARGHGISRQEEAGKTKLLANPEKLRTGEKRENGDVTSAIQ